MRIAVFSEVCLPFVNGIATQVSLLQQSLSSLGHQVLVVASDLHAQEFYTNGNVLYCPARPAKNPFDMEIIPKKEDELWELLTEFEPDLLHIHTATGLGQFAVRYSERLDLPVVTTVYDGCAGLLSYYGPSLLKGITQARCKSHIRRVLENSDCIVSASGKAAEELEACGLYHDVEAIPCAADYGRFRPGVIGTEEARRMRVQSGLPEDAPLALFAGKIGQEKNLEILIQLWAQQVRENDALCLLILGDGPERDVLTAWAEECGIAANVLFLGEVPHEEMPAYYGMCDFFVSASKSGAACTAMLEAIGCGLPALIPSSAGCAPLIREGINGFTYKSAAEFGEYVRKLASLDEEGKRLLKRVVRKTVDGNAAVLAARYLVTLYDKAIAEHYGNEDGTED